MRDTPISLQELWPSEAAGALPTRRPRKREPLPKRVGATIAFLADASRRRRSGRMALWLVVMALVVAGVGMLTYPFYTHYYAHRLQNGALKTKLADFSTPSGLEQYKRHQLKVGDPLTRIIIPKLKLNVIVVEGISGNALRAGAGHYESTALPGDYGNVAIAGHRTGFGEPFRHLERLRAGDQIILVTPLGRYTYEVVPPFDAHANPWITTATDLSVIQPTAEPSLTLTTCDPPHTSLNRMIVRARRVTVEQSI
ncbi:MAG: class E sortase [Actinomycetota bacterium]|nr:class E sortase [Actinomycetota bacterium]